MSYDRFQTGRNDSFSGNSNFSRPQQQPYPSYQGSSYNGSVSASGYGTPPPQGNRFDNEKYQDVSDQHSEYDRYPTPASQYSSSPLRGPGPQSMQGYGPSHRYAEEEELGNGPGVADDSGYNNSKSTSPFRPRPGASGSPTLSEAKLLVGPGSFKASPKKYSCCDYILCRCWPRWARWICGCCLLILVALIVVIAVIAATFKVPSVTFNGITTQDGVPEFVSNGTKFSLNFALEIGVVNDNIIGADFELIKASAFYPINHTPVGGGQLSNVNFPSHHTTNVTFPFSINYDPTLDKDQQVLMDIANRCGFLGNAKQPIVVDYTLTLYLKVLFVTISPSIDQSTSIDCPIKDGQLPDLPAGDIAAFTSVAAAATATAT